MSFISVFYLIFLMMAAVGNYLLPARLRVFWLLCAGYIFYFTWQPAFLIVLVAVTLLAFRFGKIIALAADDKKRKKTWLVISIITLLLPLVFFKYFNFLNHNLAELFGLFSLHSPLPNQPFIIPLGISFFTFQAISYVADIYRNYLKPEARLENFALYMAFFPTLLAGPIERAKSMLPQIGNPAVFNSENIRAGLQLILWGVFKKVVLADRMSDFLTKVYAEPESFPGAMIYLAVVFSAFQLFCDFSAYSDIAVGSGRILGFKLTKNFDDRVYAAPSREIFWQGWHRSLTSWLRDYVFYPLSRGVKSRARLYLNLILVYLLVGLWHGATWGFIVWGLLNGLWLAGESISKNWRKKFFERIGVKVNSGVFLFCAWLLIFHTGALFGVFFRTNTLAETFQFFSSIFNSNVSLINHSEVRNCVLTIIFLLFMDWINRQIPKNENFDGFISRQAFWFRWIIYLLLAELIIRYSFVFESVNFMYFRF